MARCVTSAIATAGSGSRQAPSPLLAPYGIRPAPWSLRLRDRGARADRRERQSAAVPSRPMAVNRATGVVDRVAERRRAVVLARNCRDAEDLSIAQVVQRLGRSPATIKAYSYDPTRAKARTVKARYVGVCRGCGTYTQSRNGKGDAYAYCEARQPRGDRASLDAGARARGDARVGAPLRPSAVLLRLVVDARPPARERGAAALEPRLLAVGERRHRCMGELVGGARCDWCSVEQGGAAV